MMRIPRVRFTIRRLMIAVLISGLGLAGAVYFQSIRDQRIAEQMAQASYQQAKLVHEVAEYALKEYEEGIYPQDQATIRGQIALAKSDLERTMDRLAWSNKMYDEGRLTDRTRNAFLLTKQKADFDLEQANAQLDVLEKYTKAKQIKSLKSDVEKARADELAKQATLQLQRARRWTIFGL